MRIICGLEYMGHSLKIDERTGTLRTAYAPRAPRNGADVSHPLKVPPVVLHRYRKKNLLLDTNLTHKQISGWLCLVWPSGKRVSRTIEGYLGYYELDVMMWMIHTPHIDIMSPPSWVTRTMVGTRLWYTVSHVCQWQYTKRKPSINWYQISTVHQFYLLMGAIEKFK